MKKVVIGIVIVSLLGLGCGFAYSQYKNYLAEQEELARQEQIEQIKGTMKETADFIKKVVKGSGYQPSAEDRQGVIDVIDMHDDGNHSKCDLEYVIEDGKIVDVVHYFDCDHVYFEKIAP